MSMAQKHTARPNAERTKVRRLIPVRRRQRSVSLSARAMIANWSRVGGGGTNSPFEHGSTSTGRASLGSGHDGRQWGSGFTGIELGHGYARFLLNARESQ